ncbi:hypothetical protein GY45DRAFT_1375589 [Cubamyces sp. BRFM 1775]|nr:hypothetical protein GY45DRAFT_1375589 [Cubamyces sp. BRFM 1775]
MGLFDILERTVQDTANVSTTSGVSGRGIVGIVAKQLPGPSIDRGHRNLREGFVILEGSADVIPKPELKSFYKEYDRVLDVGLRLQEER